jgi:hypothetical protein
MRPNFKVIHGSATDTDILMSQVADMVVALESLEHIPEHDVVRLIERIAQMRPMYFICSVPVEIGPAIWLKNLGSLLSGYMRHREYTWAETFWAGLYRLDRLPPHGIRHKGFDWRWLVQTVRHNFRIEEVRRFPVAVLPAALSSTLFLVARPRHVESAKGAASGSEALTNMKPAFAEREGMSPNVRRTRQPTPAPPATRSPR